MAFVANTFEGGTDGTTISTGNSGGISGTPFDVIIGPDVGAIIAYSKVQYFDDKLAMRIATRAAATNFNSVGWTNSSFGTLPADWYERFLVNTDAIPAANGPISLFETAAQAGMGGVALNSTGTISITNAAGGTVATSTVALVSGKWYRIEAKFHGSVTTGYIGVRIYSNPRAPIASFDEEVNFSGGVTWAMPSATCGRTHFGTMAFATNWPSASGFCYFDHLATASLTQIGPPGRIKDPLMPQFPLPPARSF